jgi:hypothetical protein
MCWKSLEVEIISLSDTFLQFFSCVSVWSLHLLLSGSS